MMAGVWRNINAFLVGTRYRAIYEPATFVGHYHSLTDVPKPTTFDKAFVEERLPGALQKPTLQSTNPLAILVATTQPNTVIDFGGSLKQGWREILGMSSFYPNYVLVELPEICRVASKVCVTGFSTTQIPTDIPKPCIVNVASSLQYVLNWHHTLRDLTALKPTHFIIANTPVSDEVTYARCQVNGRRRRLPCWVFSYCELQETMRVNGYKQVYNRIHPENYKHTGALSPSWYATMIFTPA